MKRYKITKELIHCIKSSIYSLDQLYNLTGIQVNNIYYKNKSINERHLGLLSRFLKINGVKLKEIKFDNTKNLGKYAYSEPIRITKDKEKLAEFIGIMLGDGNLYKNTTNIAFDKRNKSYIAYTKKLASNCFNIKFKFKESNKKNSAFIYFCNKYLTQKLLELGLKRGNKIKNSLGIPPWIKENRKYSVNCIRGLVDTDGTIYSCKRDKAVYIGFTNKNKQLMEDFKEITSNLGYSFANGNRYNVCLYRKAEVVRFINEIRPHKAIKWGNQRSWVL